MSVTLRTLNTEMMSEHLRARSVDPAGRRLLITQFSDTEQERDLTAPPNCDGLGRIRHFRRATSADWPTNPLPIDPACKALGLPRTDMLKAQVFQSAACNWRCWYCFVPYSLLSANPKHTAWVTPSHLVDLYLRQPEPPRMIDLTGGQPDLGPEWVPWMMQELQDRGLDERVYLWSDDNLSNDYFWRYLSEADQRLIAAYPKYGRVCCFKGFNANSFTFNTRAEPDLWDKQFVLMARLLALGLDLYAYVTFTTPSSHDIAGDIRRFVDRLQELDCNLPLRTVPLEIQVFTPVAARITSLHEAALRYQYDVVASWQEEMKRRFSGEERAMNIADVTLGGR